jgi:CheY-like chemotaxis protein
MGKTFHILIVEDSMIAQVVLKTQMIKHGCTADTASDGESALMQALSVAYDVILMDIGLGEGPDGFEVTAAIKEQSDINKETPIIAVTSHSEPEFQAKATAVGMVGYFNKPFNAENTVKILDFLKNERADFD